MKKLLTILLMSIFLISFASAFGEIADLNENNGTYGSYVIESGWGWLPGFLGGGDLAYIKLNNNTDICLIDCSAKGEAYFYEPGSFLDGIEFINPLGQEETRIEDLEILVGTYQDITDKKEVYEEVCEERYLGLENLTKTTYCYESIIKYEDEIINKLVWKIYEGEIIEGYFEWEIKASKRPLDNIDWIITVFGEKLDGWAWWNSNYDYKRAIILNSGVASSLTDFPVTAEIDTAALILEGKLNSDCSDLRFTNAAEDTELDFEIENNTCDRADTIVFLKIPSLGTGNQSSAYMYYGNSGASDGQDPISLWSDYEAVYHFADPYDSTGTHNLTAVGFTPLFQEGDMGQVITIGSGIAQNNAGYFTIGGSNFNLEQNFSISERFLADTFNIDNGFTTFNMDGNSGCGQIKYRHNWVTSGQLSYLNQEDSKSLATSGTFTTNTWYNLISQIDNSDTNLRSTKNNIEIGNADFYAGSGASSSLFGDTRTGCAYGGKFQGNETEFRLRYNYVSNDWEEAEFNTLIYIGEEEVLGAEINLISPEDLANTTNQDVTFSCNTTFDSDIANLSLIINGEINYTNSTVDDIIIINQTVTLSESNYNWTCKATTIAGDITEALNRTLTVHLTAPEVTVLNPHGNIEYLILGNNLTLNWSVNEGGENLTEHIKNCSYTYNEITTYLNISQCVEINETSFTYVIGVNNLSFNITDIYDLTTVNTTSWNIKVLEINQSYNNETTEGALETFLANIRIGSGFSITDAVLFNYNGSSNIGQSFASGDNTILRKADLVIPNVEADTNVTFYWTITLSDSTTLNLTLYNQTVYNLGIDNCSSYTNKILNFTVLDEELQTILPNATIEIAVNLYDRDRTALVLNYSMLFTKNNPVTICLNRNLTNYSTYSIDTIVRYEEITHANEYYNIINMSLNNNSETQNIELYDLNLSDSTEFQLSFTGSDFLPVEDALVYVDRQYISENKFKTVELPKTDYNGQAVLHLVRNNVIYNIRIIKDGVVLGNFENLVAFCDDFTIGDCNIELNAFDSVENIFNYNEDIGIIFTKPTYNSTTNKISFNFVTSDGSAKTVNLTVSRNDIFGNRSICNSSLVSSGGTLTCDIDPNIDESTLKVEIYVNNILVVTDYVALDTTNFGVGGYLVMFVMAISFILMFSGSKTGVLVSIGLTLASSIGLGMVSSELIGLGASGIWLLVIILIGIYKLNSQRTS